MDELWSLLDQMSPAQVEELRGTLASLGGDDAAEALTQIAAWEFSRQAGG